MLKLQKKLSFKGARIFLKILAPYYIFLSWDSMTKITNLTNECLAIGSLPHKSVKEAMDIVKTYYNIIPFCPQLPRLSPKEDMILQYLENMAGLVLDEENGTVYLDTDKETFSEELETLFLTYEEATQDINSESLDNYCLTNEYSKSFDAYIELVQEIKPQYAKTQITGPFTLATSLTDKSQRCAYYDETLKEVIVKTLALKVLWQIKEIKKVSPNTTPIVFIDEPTVSQIGTSAYVTISPNEIVEYIKEISDIIKQNSGISAIHCCGKCDWSIPLKIGMDIINFDAYSYAENMGAYANDLKNFLDNDGFIAFGVVPTLDKEALTKTNLIEIEEHFNQAKALLINKGIDKNLLNTHSLISPSCGCGSLSVELAQKANSLTKELSEKLKG